MAGRKDKNIVDYFPHYCIGGKTLFILESKYGNNGYSAWFKTLELLGSTDNHYIDCRDISTWEFVQAKMRILDTELTEILNTLANLGAIDKYLWENKVVWSENFIKNISEVYDRRKSELLTYDDLCKHLLIKCKHELIETVNNDYINSQSKVEYSRVEKSKVIYSEFYDEQITKTSDETYLMFIKFLFGDNELNRKLKKVLGWKDQIDFDRFTKLLILAKEHGKKIRDVVLDMESKQYKYDSFYRALTNWIKK